MRLQIFSSWRIYDNIATFVENSGHQVDLVTQYSFGRLFYGQEDAHEFARQRIQQFQPTHVINNIPHLNLASPDYVYIGNTEASARIETHKWDTRQKAQELGFLLPEVLEECPMNGMTQTYLEDVYLKPKYWDEQHRSWKILANTDHTLHNTKMEDNSAEGFIERDVQHDFEAICQFTICNNSYKIQHMIAYYGGGNEKIHGADDTQWKEGTRYEEIPPSLLSSWESQCTRWLDYVCTLGGNYQGGMGAGVTDTGFHWYEQNCRKGTPGVFTGDFFEWWKSLTVSPSFATSSDWELYY
jgi:hypothetical protein